MNRKLLTRLATLACVLAPFASASADLVLVDPNLITIGGTGLGAVNTVLTIQSPGSSPTEAGAVCRLGGADVIGTTAVGGACSGPGGDVQTGASQTQTRTLAEAGITNAANFGLVFNGVQPGGAGITLNTLIVNFYTNAGLLLHSAQYTGVPRNFPITDPGTGKSGYLFALDPTEQGVIQTFINSLTTAGVRVGAVLAAGNGQFPALGGPETIFIFNSQATPPQVVPEPSTTALMATGLIGLAGFARRRRRSV